MFAGAILAALSCVSGMTEWLYVDWSLEGTNHAMQGTTLFLPEFHSTEFGSRGKLKIPAHRDTPATLRNAHNAMAPMISCKNSRLPNGHQNSGKPKTFLKSWNALSTDPMRRHRESFAFVVVISVLILPPVHLHKQQLLPQRQLLQLLMISGSKAPHITL